MDFSDNKFSSDDPDVTAAETRLKRATKDKAAHKRRMDDYNRLVMPWRHQEGNEWSDQYVDEVFDNTAPDAVQDFASDMLFTFTPQHAKWIDPVPSTNLVLADAESIKPQIAAYNETIFSEIRRSNFHSEALESYMDLTHGTMAMVVQDNDMSAPIHCESIPVSDILIARGPFKTIDVKAYDMVVYADQIPVIWPEAQKNEELMREIRQAPSSERCVRQAIWRDYSDRRDEVHRYVSYVGKHKIAAGQYRGDGSCPMIVARWMTDNTTALGIGPGYLQLPNIKTANLLKELILKNLDYAVDPATTYDDDGVINMEHGISPGMHIPRAQGSKIDILESGSRFDAGYFEKQELDHQIKRGFFQDKPDQLGKTPPTASQWLDEAAQAARRMGAPSGRLITEWQIPIYKRFAYLLAKRGILPDVKLNGNMVSLNPTSPLIRTQRQEEALNMQQFAMLLGQAIGPELAQMVINPIEFAYFVADRMGITPAVLGNKAELTAMLEQFRAGQMAQAQGAGNVVV